MQVKAIQTKLFREGDSLPDFVLRHLPRLKEGSVLVVSSKIVSLSEGRTAPLSEFKRLVKKESAWARKAGKVWLTEKDGIIMANAGIDSSNGNGRLVFLPQDSYKTARELRNKLRNSYKLKKIGVIIADSVVMPRRRGVVGVALGYAGFNGVKDYKGTKDLFGRKFKFASTNVADSLATAAMLMMGEGNERRPLALVENAPVEFTAKPQKSTMKVGRGDMYGPILGPFGR